MKEEKIVVIGEGVSVSKKKLEEAIASIKNRKPGILIAVYPGMGQEIFTNVYHDYVMINLSDYRKDNPDYIKTYIEDAVRLVSDGTNSVCFIDTNTDLIKELGEMDIPFLIFYPGTSKDAVLRNLANMYLKNPSVSFGKTIADVILHYETKIAELRLYNNSIMFSNGIVSDEVIKNIIKMNPLERLDFIKSLAVMKVTAKQGAELKQTQSKKKSSPRKKQN